MRYLFFRVEGWKMNGEVIHIDDVTEYIFTNKLFEIDDLIDYAKEISLDLTFYTRDDEGEIIPCPEEHANGVMIEW